MGQEEGQELLVTASNSKEQIALVNKELSYHFLNSMPLGGLLATFIELTSFQSVDSTVPFDSTYE